MRKAWYWIVACLIVIFVCPLAGQDSSNLYDRMGVVVERGLHGAVPEENVDLFSGNLTLKNLDITLPGPNGFDLNVWRVYNSKVGTDYSSSGYSYPQQEHNSWVGYGWIMHMGRLHNPSSTNPMVEFPDGRKEATYKWIKDENILITRDFARLIRNDASHDNHPTMHFKDGTVWVFGETGTLFYPVATIPVALVTQIINSYGHTISIEYFSGTTKLKKITDALGRVVEFVLDGNGNLQSIMAPSKDGIAAYTYNVAKNFSFTYDDGHNPPAVNYGMTQLISMTPPELSPVSYTYNEQHELRTVDTSYGGRITYTFADQTFQYYDSTLTTRSLTSKTIEYDSGNSATWNYVYGDGDPTRVNYDGRDGKCYIDVSKEDGSTVRVNAGYTTVIGPATTQQAWFFGPDSQTEGWRAGTMAYQLTLDAGVTTSMSQQYLRGEQISNEDINYRGNSWGKAQAILEVGSYQMKNGDCPHLTEINYTNPALRQYGLPSDMIAYSTYNVPVPQSSNGLKLTGRLVNRTARVEGRPFRLYGAASNLLGKEELSVYARYSKVFTYAFTDIAKYPTFESRYLLTPVTEEKTFDAWGALIKDTKTDYFSTGAVQKISRWVEGSTWLDWIYTYTESDPTPSIASTITVTVDQPGAAGIETSVYQCGTLKKVSKPGYTEFDRTIYPDGLIETETNQHGGTMTFTYDGLGRITKIAMPDDFYPITAAWQTNQVVIKRGKNDQECNILTKLWDGMGRNRGFTEVGAGVTLHSIRTLDGEGRLVAESKGATDPSHKTIYQLNANGQPTRVTDPTDLWVKYEYEDNTVKITDQKGNTKTLAYGYLPGMVTSVAQGETQTTHMYSGENRLGIVQIVAGGSTRAHYFSYNGMDQLAWETHPELGSSECGTIDYTYNGEGNLFTKKWPDATTLAYAYNTSNQLTGENDPKGKEAIVTGYDSSGRVSEITGYDTDTSAELWKRSGFAYNALGAVKAETTTIAIAGLPVAKTLGYSYDGNGALATMTYPDGRIATTENNTLFLPQTLTFSGQSLVSAVGYGVNKQPTSITYGNGTAYSAGYDKAGRIQAVSLGSLFAATYGYDLAGNIDTLSNTVPAGNASFTYDTYNRLTRAEYTSAGKVFDYGYDPFGNLTEAKENNITVFAKPATAQNRIGGFTYDPRGNLTQDDGFSYEWDGRNRMAKSFAGPWATRSQLGTYRYDSRGLRLTASRSTQSTVQVVAPNGGENLYLGALTTISWSGAGLGDTVKLELLVDGAVVGTIADNVPATQTSCQWQAGKTLTGFVNPSGNVRVRVSSVVPASANGTTYYLYGSDGKLLSEYDGTGVCVKDYLYLGGKQVAEYQPVTGKYYWYTSDQINSTRMVTDGTGAVVYSRQYDPYGGVLSTETKVYEPKLGFSGKEREAGSGIDYFGARYYDHKWYRFNSVDPIMYKEESISEPKLWNLYSYCSNNPVSRVDPNGMVDFHLNVGVKNIKEGTAYTNWERSKTLTSSIDDSNKIHFSWSLMADIYINMHNNSRDILLAHEKDHIRDKSVISNRINNILSLVESYSFSNRESAEKIAESAILYVTKIWNRDSIKSRDYRESIVEGTENCRPYIFLYNLFYKESATIEDISNIGNGAVSK